MLTPKLSEVIFFFLVLSATPGPAEPRGPRGSLAPPILGPDKVFNERKIEIQSENSPENGGSCRESMFMSSDTGKIRKAAHLGCMAQHAFQRNWFPDPIAGLFSYQSWNGMDGFWQNGIAIETMANTMHYGNHTRYFSVLKGSLREVDDLKSAYAPCPSFDDMAWYALAYLRVHEIFGLDGFLRVAKDLFHWCWNNGWDVTETCGGGVWFDQSQTGKATIENAQLFQLAMKLARFSNNSEEKQAFQEKAEKLWKFLTNATGILDPASFQVYDGIDSDTCKVSNKSITFTYTAGCFIGGLVEEYKLKKDVNSLKLAHNITQSVMKHLTKNGVLMELCDINDACNLDEKAFKGIFVRNLRYLLDTSENIDLFQAETQTYTKFLEHNVEAMVANASCVPESDKGLRRHEKAEKDCHIVYLDGPPSYNKTGPVFGAVWNSPFVEARPMLQSSAMDLLNAATGLGGKVKCKGRACKYDPPNPPPQKLSCEDDPCPTGRECCGSGSSYYTCCADGQKCVEHIYCQ